jgi:hypothetical protein
MASVSPTTVTPFLAAGPSKTSGPLIILRHTVAGRSAGIVLRPLTRRPQVARRGVLDYLALQEMDTPRLRRRELAILLFSVLIRGADLDWYEPGDVWGKVAQ